MLGHTGAVGAGTAPVPPVPSTAEGVVTPRSSGVPASHPGSTRTPGWERLHAPGATLQSFPRRLLLLGAPSRRTQGGAEPCLLVPLEPGDSLTGDSLFPAVPPESPAVDNFPFYPYVTQSSVVYQLRWTSMQQKFL